MENIYHLKRIEVSVTSTCSIGIGFFNRCHAIMLNIRPYLFLCLHDVIFNLSHWFFQVLNGVLTYVFIDNSHEFIWSLTLAVSLTAFWACIKSSILFLYCIKLLLTSACGSPYSALLVYAFCRGLTPITFPGLLYSVLVHSGGVHGGHYYAFIRPTLSDQW